MRLQHACTPSQGRRRLVKSAFRVLSGLLLLSLTSGAFSPASARPSGGGSTSTAPKTYYVSNQGNDKWAGTSSSQPWKTIDRVNKQDLNPGDQVLFAGGQTFVGSLSLVAGDSGTIASPIVISSYGTGTAWISSGAQAGLFGYNVSGVTVSNLNFIGGGSTNTTSGVSFYTDSTAGADGITLSSLDVSGYQQIGIEVGSWNATVSGYRHIKVTGSKSHHNADNGFLIYSQYPNVNQVVYIGQVTASYNAGHGISFGGVSGGTIESSQAYENGTTTDTTKGPVGVMVYDSTQVVVQNNTAYRNHTVGSDGDGFDLDKNVSYSTLQNNTSYENDGAGYLLAHAPANSTHTGNIVQYNTSTNDSRKLGYGAIQAWGRVRNATIRNNTVTLNPGTSSSITAISLVNWSIPSNCIENITISANNFTAASGPKLVNASSSILQCSTGISFQVNTYQGNPFSILWGSTTYTSLTAWTTATGQN